MYFRRKTSAGRVYLQIVESRRQGNQVRQQVIATLGRYDELRDSGQLDRLLRSGARFAAQAIILDAVRGGTANVVAVRRIGPALVFERLWQQTGCRDVIETLARERKHAFALERAVFLTVLHRLFGGGSDRAADRWQQDYRIDGVDELALHQLYRAMAWLGEELPAMDQDGRTPFAPRCIKDVVEERLFAARRDLFSGLDLVFMDTTSLYFEGAGGQTLGRHGYSKDHRPDLRQMILAVVLDGEGQPVCSEMWPGNTADVTSLLPVIERLRRRFAIGRVCVVADRGMISSDTLAALEAAGLRYIIGARERTDTAVRDVVLADTAPFVPLTMAKRSGETDYGAKAVTFAGQRYIVCRNDQQARKDAADRAAILAALERQLKNGDKALVGNTAYRRFLKKALFDHPQLFVAQHHVQRVQLEIGAQHENAVEFRVFLGLGAIDGEMSTTLGSGTPNICLPPDRSSTSLMRPSVVTCSAASSPLYSRKRWKIASPCLDAPTPGPRSSQISIH